MKNKKLSEIVASDLPTIDNQSLSAIWLISEWLDPIWILEATNDTPRIVNDEWRGVIYINFKQILPNGKMLTDPEYSELLEDIKRTIYFLREGVYGHEVTRSEGQQVYAYDLFSLVCFMVNQGLDQPSTLLNFSSLTRSHFYDFCKLAVEGGSSSIEGHIRRITTILENLTCEELASIRLTDGSLDRTWLSNQAHISLKELNQNRKLIVALRKYELCDKYPDYQNSSAFTPREFPSHRDIEENKLKNVSQSRVTGLISVWSYLKCFNEYLTHPLSFDPFSDGRSPASIALHLGAVPGGRTPTIPIDTAMYYLNSAIKWVTVYGAALVEYKSALDTELEQTMKDRTARKDHYAPKAFSEIYLPEKLLELNIERYNRHRTGTSINTRRSTLAVDDAINCLIAACFILFATFSARRRREILRLNIDSIIAGPDGWDIEFGIQKASAVSRLEKLRRPIPDLLVHAAKLLTKLYPSLRESDEDKVLSKRLFVKALQGNYKNNLTPIDISLLNIIDLFADVIEVPIDRHGRRWYFRPHEGRRFFAITYYWHRKYQNLDALSWFLGHLDPEETRTYITNAYGQMELDEEERKFTIDAIRRGMHTDELRPLTKHISEHFNTANLDLIEPLHLESYIQKLIENDCLDIRVRSLSMNSVKSDLFIEFIEPEAVLD